MDTEVAAVVATEEAMADSMEVAIISEEVATTMAITTDITVIMVITDVNPIAITAALLEPTEHDKSVSYTHLTLPTNREV